MIVVTADSSFWITSDSAGVRFRGVPMLLARVDGRFRELYVADDDRSFFDAVFIGQRLFARDLLRGDSVELLRDTVVPRLAREYAAEHPDQEPLQPDEETSPRPTTTATAEVEVLDAFGPYVSYEHHTDVDVVGGRGRVDAHAVRRGVLDLRTARNATVQALFGDTAAHRALGEAELEWRAARDSLLALQEDQLPLARRAVSAFTFDALSFTLGAESGDPRVIFAVPGDSRRGEVSVIELTPIPMPEPQWWRDVRAELPIDADDEERWTIGGTTLVARADPGAIATRLFLLDSARREWTVGHVSSRIGRVWRLDATLPRETRRALNHAFDEAASYDGERRIAAAPRRVRDAAVPVAAASLRRTRQAVRSTRHRERWTVGREPLAVIY